MGGFYNMIMRAVCLALVLFLGTQVSIAKSLQKSAFDLPDFSRLFKEASPAVVNINTLAKPKTRSHMHSSGADELLRRYFGIHYPDRPAEGGSKPMSLGSGFIISEDGFILTNYHIIEGADEIIVKLSDRSETGAELVGFDKRSDLAVLKIETKQKLPIVRIGSGTLQAGQWVAAIGSPFNFEYSITKGIVSAVNRSLPNDAYVPFVQTDVPINSGNSGGPLFNMSGEVVGINSRIFTQTGGFMGLSFAIPIDHVMWAVKQIKEKGYVTRGWLGVLMQEVDRDLAESFGLDKPMGALVKQIVPGGPADKAKLQLGDVIVGVNSRPVYDSSSLPVYVGILAPGSKAEIEYVRNGKKKNLILIIGELPDDSSHSGGQSRRKKGPYSNRLGVQVSELDNDYRSKLELDESTVGLVVISIMSGVANSIGLRQGDVITDINNARVKNVMEFKEAVKKLPVDHSISMRIVRDGHALYITFRLVE
ncbi:MAG: Do family serine endopeptidase [Candidatus Endonucleobacter bathymodioli]|uniref:Probable periplasmic serine endoprotease DegP-like n=1 Tax=Candidatus Endonucleibacter bathymodioli TaxID=539814 RepID=A0AA90SWG7_9GAMM|nr:Do family serine endopeptidase [Candidatus Endonucleobacter bathymodioli]